jgi:hypothetical protein
MTALSCGANRQHSSTAAPPPSLSLHVFQHHSPKEGSAAEKFRDHGRWLVEVSADRLYRVLSTVDRKPPLSSCSLYLPRVLDWPQDEVTSCQRHVTGLMAKLRDGQMTTHFGPVFGMNISSMPS